MNYSCVIFLVYEELRHLRHWIIRNFWQSSSSACSLVEERSRPWGVGKPIFRDDFTDFHSPPLNNLDFHKNKSENIFIDQIIRLRDSFWLKINSFGFFRSIKLWIFRRDSAPVRSTYDSMPTIGLSMNIFLDISSAVYCWNKSDASMTTLLRCCLAEKHFQFKTLAHVNVF